MLLRFRGKPFVSTSDVEKAFFDYKKLTEMRQGGTIGFHLRTAVGDKNLAQEIQENLYIDNLILGGDTPKR
ncbi:hypothetical protein ANCDUO_02306 [Ancylostoma duodenale]|uniref:Uncharacterized protein n=1 Tax=Ancylostoma duodenale TaxID=51022 RepID=A0A0C2H783_9BILA|nr:hypothetical protein ANCDUO_02306 [Ancylostoma duodenale]